MKGVTDSFYPILAGVLSLEGSPVGRQMHFCVVLGIATAGNRSSTSI
eukprot:COSAG03_NODE_192_length_10857_cov_11.152259_8_plen_47_part_00